MRLFNILTLIISGDVELNPGPPLKFCHLNARSLLAGVDLDQHIQHQYSLLDEIYETLVYENNFDIITISESWLKDNIPINELDLNGYQEAFMRNRGTLGGGVMVYVREGIAAVERVDLHLQNVESLWLEIKISGRRILFGTYIWF